MVELYYWPTPNGHKITMFLEEAGINYTIKAINLPKGEQFTPAYECISPTNQMPVIVDHTPLDGGAPLTIFESGAILLYLAEKTSKFLPALFRERMTAMEWLFWQVGGLGPIAVQNYHFGLFAKEKIPYAINRYVQETKRLYRNVDRQLNEKQFIAGEKYSIGDMAIYPWIKQWKRQQQHIDEFPNLQRWLKSIDTRPGTTRAYAHIKNFPPPTPTKTNTGSFN